MKAYSEDLRKRVIESYQEGKEKGEIIKIFKIGISTLNRWIREYQARGSYARQERTKYRRRKFSDEELMKYVEEKPSARLDEMAKHFKVKLASVWQRLKQLKITRKKSFVDEARNEEKRQEFVEELEKKGDRPLLFIDECGIKNNLKHEYGRAPRGVAVVDEVKGRATEKMNLLAGLLNHAVIAPLAYDCNTNTEVFNTWLKECLIPILPPNSILVLDNARFHKSEETKKLVEVHGHQLLFLPPYSPDLNPIEKCWAVIKRKLRNLLENHHSIYSCIEIIFQTN